MNKTLFRVLFAGGVGNAILLTLKQHTEGTL
jgi:hypothetical protein